MWLFKCIKANDENDYETEPPVDDVDNEEERVGHTEEEFDTNNQVKLVYFACNTPNEDVINTLNLLSQTTVESFRSEKECVEYVSMIRNKVFIIIDGAPPTTLVQLIEPLTQIDSLFVYSSSSDSIPVVCQKQHGYLVHWCETKEALIARIKLSHEEVDKQMAVFSIFNKKEKETRDLSKEAGSFLFFQLFFYALKKMPKTIEAKTTMLTICRYYYRRNLIELRNIEEFDKTYKSVDAISWFTKDTFIHKLINKAFRTEDLDVLYRFRFYIMDLSKQLLLKFVEFKKKQKDVLKLYRAVNLTDDEVTNFEKNIGNFISPNGYLLTSSERSVAYDFATTFGKTEGVARVLFEYQVDLNVVAVVDIREYSAFPEGQFLVDIGASFQIDSCQFNAEEDFWHIQVHAASQDTQYIDYQKKKLDQSNIVLMFGNLLLEMSQYENAQRYFDTVLNSSNPNDEEIASLFFNYGHIHRLKGDFNRAINCYNRAYHFHMTARPKRFANAGKTLNDLGVVYSEQGNQSKAEECFLRAMKFYKGNISQEHVHVAQTLIHLSKIDCDRQHYDQALAKCLKAKNIYDRSLPLSHPDRVLLKVHFGNVYLSTGHYEKALEEYESALQIQESSLPGDHLDLARTLHYLSIVQARRGDNKQAKQYLERAQQIADRTLSKKHPLIVSLDQTKKLLLEEV